MDLLTLAYVLAARKPDVVNHRAQKKVGHHNIEKGGVKIIGSECCPAGESVEWRANVESIGGTLSLRAPLQY